MAKKEKEPPKEGVLVEAAKAIGSATGKIAAKIGVAAPQAKPGKLAPKNKSRLPRKQKKALRKSGASQRTPA